MKIYFVAHATTTDNEAKLASGWKDVGLSELGIKQANELRDQVKDLDIDLVCCSDLKRATDTVKIAFGDKLPVIIDQRLRELNYGDLNGAPKEQVEALKLKAINEPYPNGESYNQAIERTHAFYKELKEKHPDKIVLVVGHRATQYGLDTLVNNKNLEELVSTPFKWQPYWEYKI
ncbi:MAG: histidine phosphatase family protein [Candidatus Paceibacterota bacterium]|jgi:broad specificity phosphatase PhoE